MKVAVFAAAWMSLAGIALRAQNQPPVITAKAVVNAASRVPPGLPSYGIAQGSLFSVTGQRLAAATPPISVADSPQTSLAGASMQITVGGTKVDVPMVSVSAGFYQDDSGRYDQLAGIVPAATPVGTGTITVTVGGQTSAPAPITIVPSAFGIFTLNHGGVGPGVFSSPDLTFNSMTDASHLLGPFAASPNIPVNSLVAAAHPGDSLVIWGTGLGASPADAPVEVYVGNVEADVAAQGPASCCSGIEQIQFTVPDGVQGCYVPVAVKIGAVVSNFATVSISPDGSVCSDPIGFSTSDLQSSATGAPKNIAGISLGQLNASFSIAGLGSAQGKIDFASGGFRRYPGTVGVLSAITGTGGGLAIPSAGCVVYPFGSNGPLFDNFLPNPGNDIPFAQDAPYQLLDAGAALNVKGPAGARELPKNQNVGMNGTEYKVPGSVVGGGLPPLIPVSPDFIVPGGFTVDNSSGGADVKGFTANLTVPTDYASWTGQDAIGDIDRSQDLPITWSGSGLVAVFGSSANPSTGFGAQFICISGPAGNGSLNVPAWVLSALPVSGLGTDIPAPVAFLGLATGPPATRFQATGIDFGYFSWFAAQLKNVNFK
jgi:uncharacterized protein (TIGR03437 family)